MKTRRARHSEIHWLVLGWSLLCAMPAIGQSAATGTADLRERQTQGLAATCAACHGTNGRTVPGSEIPQLAGLPKDTFLQRMLGFRDGSRPATVMHQISNGYSPEQVEALAVYFSSIKERP